MDTSWLDMFRIASARQPIVLALATVDLSGDPQVRSVICRHVDEQGWLWISSDARSAKHTQLLHRPKAAAVAWFPNTREQFRINATVRILDSSSDDPKRVELWHTLTPATRVMFYWPAPGHKRLDTARFEESSECLDPPASFEILVLIPTAVDYLLLATHPHRRLRWELETQWTVQELNP